MIRECKAKYYNPGLARMNRAWGTTCPDSIVNKKIDTKSPSNTEFTMGPEQCLEVDNLKISPLSNGYKHIIFMMDVFSGYVFAYNTQDMTAGRCTIDVKKETLISTNSHTDR